MGEYTRNITKPKRSELPDECIALLRLGAEQQYKMIAWPAASTGDRAALIGAQAIEQVAGFLVYLCIQAANRIKAPACIASAPFYAAEHVLTPQPITLWDVKRWSSTALRLSAERQTVGDKPHLTAWIVASDYTTTLDFDDEYGRDREGNTISSRADHRLAVVALDSSISVVGLSPADVHTKRAGL